MWRLSISRETKVAPLLRGATEYCFYLCQVRAHEPLELFEFLHVVLDDVGADHIQLVQLGDGLAVVGDEGVVVLDQRLRYSSVPTRPSASNDFHVRLRTMASARPSGVPPRVAMRSAVSSA